MMYGVVLEVAADGSIGAYIPDMPGVAVVGTDRGEALQLLDQAVRWHVEGLIEDGLPIPEPVEKPGYEAALILDRTFVQHTTGAVAQYILGPSSNAAPLWELHFEHQRAHAVA